MNKFESFTFFLGGWFKRHISLKQKSDSIYWQGATGKGSGTKRCFVLHKNLYKEETQFLKVEKKAKRLY